jgi:hypothetical protein
MVANIRMRGMKSDRIGALSFINLTVRAKCRIL